MIQDYIKIIEKAKINRKATLHFLKKLKNKVPKQLDLVVQKIHDETFEEIDCLKCANCCKTTGPLITEKDIETIARFLKIKPSEFITQYLKIDEDQDYIFKSMPCPFLGFDNYCSIYNIRPKACRTFPHTDRKKIYQINHLTIENVEICPAASIIIQRLENNLRL